jgi:hypothetical protein
MSMETIRADFDRLAQLEEAQRGWSHNEHYLMNQGYTFL